MKKAVKIFFNITLSSLGIFCLLGGIALFNSWVTEYDSQTGLYKEVKQVDGGIFFIVVSIILLIYPVINLIKFFRNKKKKSILKKDNLEISNNNYEYKNNITSISSNETYKDKYIDEEFINNYRLIMVLREYTQARKIPQNNYEVCRYYSYELHIDDALSYVKGLIQNNLLRNANYEEILETLPLNTLKEIARDNNLKISGKKVDIAKRIENVGLYLPIYDKVSEYYVLSDLGKQIYESNLEYEKFHQYQKYHIELYTLYIYRKKYSKEKGYHFLDCVWHILTDNLEKMNDSFSIYTAYRNITDFLISECNRNEVAINFCVQYIVYELCGVNILQNYKWYCENKEFYSSEQLLFSIKNTGINQSLFNHLLVLQNLYNNSYLENAYNSLKMPIQLCSIAIAKEIIDIVLKAEKTYLINISEINTILKTERLKNIKKYL